MRLRQLYEDGRIVNGVNTTADVGPDEIKKQAAKFGNTVDKDGRPPTLSKKVKGSSTNVLYNLGLTESIGSWLKTAFNNDPQFKAWYKIYKKNPKKAEQYFKTKHTEYLAMIGESINFFEALGEIASATEIFVDMDGVLADFFGDWAKLMGVDHWTDIGQDDIPDALEKIKQTENFWLDLPLTANARQLLGLIKQVKGEYKILSSPLPGDPNSEPHKREWIKNNLGFFPPADIIITHDKAKYATQQDGTPNILIDDYGVNINKWEAAGGIGFKHKDHKFERTAKNIKQHMQEPVEV